MNDRRAGERFIAGLRDHFEELKDHRVQARTLYSLQALLGISILGMLCGARNREDLEVFAESKTDLLHALLDLPENKTPSASTFERFFARLRPRAFSRSFTKWMQALAGTARGDLVSLDGKAVRHAMKRAGEDSSFCLVSAWSSKNRMVLGQLKTEQKSNEITALPKLIRMLDLEGATVSIDAAGCQTNIAEEVTNAGADYVFSLKGNQESTYREVGQFLLDASVSKYEGVRVHQHEEQEQGHGRVEARRYTATSDLDWMETRSKWHEVESVVMVERKRTQGGKTSQETSFYLTSLPASEIKQIGMAIRSHWGIENQLHWVLDVVFKEDENGAHTGYAVENLGMLGRLSLSLHSRVKGKRSYASSEKAAGWDNGYLFKLLFATNS